MKWTLFENASIAVAGLALGVMAGFFWAYTFNVNIAMLTVDGETYARMQSLFNQHVRHPMFFSFFFGSGCLILLATVINYKQIKHLRFWFLLAATLMYIFGIIVFTHQVNLPLNYYTESWDPLSLPAHWEDTRDEWNKANAIRVLTSFLSFALCLIALCLRPKQTPNINYS